MNPFFSVNESEPRIVKRPNRVLSETAAPAALSASSEEPRIVKRPKHAVATPAAVAVAAPTTDDMDGIIVEEPRLCFNRTAGEYFVFHTPAEYDARLAHLLTLLTRTSLHVQDHATSRWTPTDHVLLVPPHLTVYVESNYNQIGF